FERTCDDRPGATALECDGETLSYQALDERANQLAHHLVAAGLRPGARVGILVPRSVGMYVSVLAVLKVGAAFVPIDPAAPADRVGYKIGRASCRARGGIRAPAGRVLETRAADR